MPRVSKLVLDPPETGFIRRAAQELIDAGILVLPTTPGSKSPAIKWTQFQIDRPEPRMYDQWFKFDGAGIWAMTGRQSGHVVIDCDSPQGHTWWANVVGEETLAATAVVRTGKGHHHWFRIPAGRGNPIRSWKIDGLFDFQADARGVMVPPSTHSATIRYEWLRPLSDATDAPEAMLDGSLIVVPDRPVLEGVAATLGKNTGSGISNGPRYAETVLANSVARLEASESRGVDLNTYVFELYRFAAAGWIDKDLVDAEIQQAMVVNGYLESDGQYAIDKTLTNAWADAQAADILTEAKPAAAPPKVAAEPHGAWEPADVANFFENPPAPLERVGRGGMLYRETLHWLSGDPDSGKSVLAYAWAVDFMEAGENVVILDEEAGLRSVAEKLRDLGATPPMVRRHLTYLPPAGRDIVARVAELQKLVAKANPRYVLLDSAAPHIMAMGGGDGDENSAQDVTRFINKALLPMANEGRTVLVIDHMTKASGGSGRNARGSGSKLAATQVAYTLQCQEPFHKQKAGKISVTCEKDRNGDIGRGSKWLADVIPSAITGGVIGLRPHQLTEEQIAKGKATQAARTSHARVLTFLRDNPTTTGHTVKEISEHFASSDKPLAANHVSTALNKLAGEGSVEFTLTGTTKRWSGVD